MLNWCVYLFIYKYDHLFNNLSKTVYKKNMI